jgi:hypothetical protein
MIGTVGHLFPQIKYQAHTAKVVIIPAVGTLWTGTYHFSVPMPFMYIHG